MLGSKLLLHIIHSLAEIPVSPFILGFPPFLSSIRPLHFTMCCPTLLSPIFPIALPTLQWWREGGCNKMLFADSAKTEAVWHPATHGTHMTCRWQRVEEKVLDSPWPPSSTPFPSLSLFLSLPLPLFFSSPLSILLTRHAVFILPTDTFDTALVWAWWRKKKRNARTSAWIINFEITALELKSLFTKQKWIFAHLTASFFLLSNRIIQGATKSRI